MKNKKIIFITLVVILILAILIIFLLNKTNVKKIGNNSTSQEIVDYISTKKGGEGAFRDVMQYILRQRGQWEQAYKNCYHII